MPGTVRNGGRAGGRECRGPGLHPLDSPHPFNADPLIAHVVGDKVEAAYRRGDLFDKRRQLADAWARYCPMPATAGQVVAIGGV